jgi:rare lipoprotein A
MMLHVFLLVLPVALALTGVVPAADAAQRKPKGTTGLASYYARMFQGEKTASGEVFDNNELVAAHPTYPLGTVLRVTNLENGRSVTVRVIDRGPTPENQAEGVVIDLSRRAAAQLRILKDGRAPVRIRVLKSGKTGKKAPDRAGASERISATRPA